MSEKETIQTDVGYIKLYKVTKRYNWEIKMFDGQEDMEAFKELVCKVEELNNIMLNKFGGEIE